MAKKYCKLVHIVRIISLIDLAFFSTFSWAGGVLSFQGVQRSCEHLLRHIGLSIEQYQNHSPVQTQWLRQRKHFLAQDLRFTGRDLKAIDRITSLHHFSINTSLRTGPGPTIPEDKETTETLREIFSRPEAKTKSELRVYRAVPHSFVDAMMAAKTGAVLPDPGFKSTTLDCEVARRFCKIRKNCLVVEILVPEGTPVILITRGEYMDFEKEILLPDSVNFKISTCGPEACLRVVQNKDFTSDFRPEFLDFLQDMTTETSLPIPKGSVT